MKKVLSFVLAIILMSTSLIGVTAAENTVKLDAVFVAGETDTTEIRAIPDSNSFAVKISMVNRGSEEKVVLYWAGYTDDGKIASMKTIGITLPENTTKEEIVPLTSVDRAQKCKLFAWGSPNTPYIDALTIEREKVSEWSDWYDYDFYAVAGASDGPAITVTGASIKIPVDEKTTDMGFKMTVNTPIARNVEILEQGAAVVPFYMIGETDFTLETENVSKIINDESRNSPVGKNRYEFVSVLEDMPVHNYRAPICVKGYVTYLSNGKQNTVYSGIGIYDVYSVAEQIIKSETENDTTKNAVSAHIKDAYNSYINSVGTGDENMLSLSAPESGAVVYPYEDCAKKYLLAGEKLKAGEYANILYYGPFEEFDVTKAIDISWACKYENVDTFTVVYATKQDFSDAKFAYASGNANKVSLYNLYKASDYYVKVIANLQNGTSYRVLSTFKTADLGPRTIHLDGSANARDVGGYMTSSGKRTMQGLIYRSGQMDQTYAGTNTALSAYGRYTAQRELGIITDLDFRGSGISPVPGATHMFVGLSGYDLVSASNQAKIRDTFKIFANINNYPIVFHCTGGADRTGTVAYLLNALLGVSERDLVRDYEWTSYSIYSIRSIRSTDYIAKESYKFFDTLNAQKGKTLQIKVENYLLSIGVTAEEIANIKSIMFTGRAPRTITVPDEFKLSKAVELKINIGGVLEDVSKYTSMEMK